MRYTPAKTAFFALNTFVIVMLLLLKVIMSASEMYETERIHYHLKHNLWKESKTIICAINTHRNLNNKQNHSLCITTKLQERVKYFRSLA